MLRGLNVQCEQRFLAYRSVGTHPRFQQRLIFFSSQYHPQVRNKG